MFGTGLRGLLRDIELTLGIILSSAESCDGDGGSLVT